MDSLEYAKFWSWLVYQFGPSVNVGNVPPRRVPRLESIRRGTTFDMNHAYIRWLREGKPTSGGEWRFHPTMSAWNGTDSIRVRKPAGVGTPFSGDAIGSPVRLRTLEKQTYITSRCPCCSYVCPKDRYVAFASSTSRR
ncbi:phosphosulfolactate synthase [Natrialba asiatica]|uniref:phosphosulfolactate synthase n=1 Tax=Natrialba asiatica TaxID=64602 RepID=UPI0013761C2C